MSERGRWGWRPAAAVLRVCALGLAGCCALGLAGCSGATAGETPTPVPTPTTPSAGYVTASWAAPVATTGRRLGDVSDKRIRITVYQVATAPAPEASVMVDPSDSRPVITKGERIVVLRYVVTNVSTDPINLGIGTVAITARYPDWPWAQPLIGVRAPSLMAHNGAPTSPLTPGTQRPPYVLGAGQSFMVGQNAPYETAEELQVSAKVDVSDDSGADDASLAWTVSGSVHLD